MALYGYAIQFNIKNCVMPFVRPAQFSLLVWLCYGYLVDKYTRYVQVIYTMKQKVPVTSDAESRRD